jgi:hypothetical protein
MKLTKKKAKKLTIEVWSYLRDHPWIDDKADLPERLFIKIGYLLACCPLCEYINGEYEGPCLFDKCIHCALDCCFNDDSTFAKWETASSDEERQKYASQIVKKTKIW